MKTNKLLKLLNSIEGNPDILLWNGFVSDWMDIELTDSILVKPCKQHIEKCLRMESMIDKNRNLTVEEYESISAIASNISKNSQWDTPNEFLNNTQFKEWYGTRTKSVVFIEGKLRNKSDSSFQGPLIY